MIENELTSIEELELEVSGLRELAGQNPNVRNTQISGVLFRGHSDSSWNLDTTLERSHALPMAVKSYDSLLRDIAPEIEANTGMPVDIDSKGVNTDEHFLRPPKYEFMAYLRHHGFPTPLLDWSRSLYVALFFAYQFESNTEHVAIYAYIDSLSPSKVHTVGKAHVCLCGENVRTHRRHFLQQGQYTVAVSTDENGWVYVPHRDAFHANWNEHQNIVTRFLLPSSLRIEVLTKLYSMNIHANSLMPSEGSLIDALKFREFSLFRGMGSAKHARETQEDDDV